MKKRELDWNLGRGLRSYDPEELACDTVQAVSLQIDNLAARLFPPARAAEMRAVSRRGKLAGFARERALGCELGLAVAALTRFAREGEAMAMPVSAHAEMVVEAAFGAALASSVSDRDLDRLDAPLGAEGPLAATLVDVVLAARTRVHIGLEEDVSLLGLAALTGKAVDAIRFQMGVTQRVTWVTASRARAWLATLSMK